MRLLSMNIWRANKLKRMVSRFEKSQALCGQCNALLSIDGLMPLSLMRCGRCGYMNVIPMRVAGFWLYQPLGGGGSGSVYLAYWPEAQKDCAMKVLHASESQYDKAVAMLRKEAETLAHIRSGNHPCIVQFFSSGITNDECFLAMEYIEGERLDLRIARTETVSERDALRILLYLLAAERHIYRHGYLYADMKPENIIIRKNKIPVVIDFGLCMTVEEAAQPKKAFVGGSPYYLPPERLQQAPEGPYSEIYSLGMVMFSALTGDTFFKFAGDIQDLAMKHIQTARLSVSQSMMPQCSPAIVEMVGRMIRKDPAERYQTFEEVEFAAMQCLKRARK